MNERLQGNEAVFFRVLQHGETQQTALVLLNKGDAAQGFEVSRYLQPGQWRDALDGGTQTVTRSLKTEVPAHGVKVFVLEGEVKQAELLKQLDTAMADQQVRTQRLKR
ncbi:hypothetical protein D3C81_751080 [compost metagenome]